MMAVTGTIFDIKANPEAYRNVTYGTNISRPALVQIVAFLLGTVFLIVYGAKALHVRSERNVQSEGNQN